MCAKLGKRKPKNFSSLITKENEEFITPTVIDFLEKILIYDHEERLTA